MSGSPTDSGFSAQRRPATRRKTAPLRPGGGEYDDPRFPRGLRNARSQFLKTLGRLAPDCEASLRSDVLPKFLAYPNPPDQATQTLVHWKDVAKRARDNKRARAVKKALLGWARRWHLQAEWLYDAALVLLSFWYLEQQNGLTPVDKPWDLAILWFFPPGKEKERARELGLLKPFRFDYPRWDPTRSSKNDFQSRATNAFRERLTSYLAEIDSLAGTAFQDNSKISALSDFDWAVRFQVCEDSYGQIARDDAPSRPDHFTKTVRRQVRNVLKIVRLKQRRAKPGRPKNEKGK